MVISRCFHSLFVALSIQRLLLLLRWDLKVVWVTLVGWRNSKLGRPEGHIKISNYWSKDDKVPSMFQKRHDKYWHSKPAVKYYKYMQVPYHRTVGLSQFPMVQELRDGVTLIVRSKVAASKGAQATWDWHSQILGTMFHWSGEAVVMIS